MGKKLREIKHWAWNRFSWKYLEVDGFSADWALLIDVLCLLWGDEITEFSLTQSASFSSWRVESLRDDRLKSSKSELSSSAALKARKKICFVFILILKRRAFDSQLLLSCSATVLARRARVKILFVYFLVWQSLLFVKVSETEFDLQWCLKNLKRQR